MNDVSNLSNRMMLVFIHSLTQVLTQVMRTKRKRWTILGRGQKEGRGRKEDGKDQLVMESRRS